MTGKHTARETWLQAAVEEMALWFPQVSANYVPRVRVSCSWAKRMPKGSFGGCWPREADADGITEIQISPEIDDPGKVLHVLLHEMIHASDYGASKHNGYFRKTALDLGLEGWMTATVPGKELRKRLSVLAVKLGPYPRADNHRSRGADGSR